MRKKNKIATSLPIKKKRGIRTNLKKVKDSETSVKGGSAGSPSVALEGETSSDSPPRFMAAVRMSRSVHRGPLPPAKEFALYNQGVPDAAERILCMAEEEQKIKARERLLGLKSSFVITLALIVAVLIIALFSRGGYPAYAVLTALLLTFSGGGVFYLINRMDRNKD